MEGAHRAGGLLLAMASLVSAIACGDDSASNDAGADAGPVDAFVEEDAGGDGGPIDAGIDAGPMELPTCEVLAAFDVMAIEAPERDSSGYEVPEAATLDAFEQALRSAIAGDAQAALEAAARASYQVCRGAGTEDDLLLLAPLPPYRGWARVAVRTRDYRRVIFEAPHPFYDEGTLAQAVALFTALRAQAVIVSGTHRCATPMPSGCDGTTDACAPDEAYRVSDVAHATDSIFHRAHVVLASAFARDVVVSLHGMGGDGVSLSDGTLETVQEDAPVARLAAALTAAGIENVTSCNPGTPVPVMERLCGTNNVQGRHVNGSPDECTTAAPMSNKRFVHVEQSRLVRESLDTILGAFATAIPM